ncbi:unnamed protein product (macronuclear) [Paramecium tetraurelia]|uniref:Protein kinase domain-containing protein n=1 Tax=Paramecium tetraurelia TaxID=5888 RepID=A0CDT3_PARTE|nr:uncharacterized protein GSPATT00007162001 [Paramecium tetraurelia]CAK68950.1 unnamed protein product [Paramecium tetraurelia]|eukprot:XP_001436347.1 hypothetical protein (macronuclear) [Paramecium tetraurelia strain d4-2]
MLQQSQQIDYLYIPTSKNLQQLLKTTTFWTIGNIQSTHLIKSQLLNRTKNKNCEYALTNNGYLIKFGTSNTKYCYLLNNLYIITYTNKYFTVRSQDKSKEYQGPNEKLTRIWIEYLTRFCIIRGEVYNRFKFINQISNGNYSKGYLIENDEKRQFVCKSFQKADLQMVIKLKDSVIGEILLLRQVNHPNVIKLFEIHEDSKNIYLIYEWAMGELFQEFQQIKAKKSRFTEQKVSHIMRQIFLGLSYIHSLNIMHRDIKLENILIKDQSSIIIADFGLAAKKLPKFEFKKYGTPGYIAPEVLNLKVYNEKVDIFSAGVVAYILLTQKPLFIGSTISAILNQNTAGKIDFEKPSFINLSKDAQFFLRKVLSLEEDQRPSAQDCLESSFLKNQFQLNEIGSPIKPNLNIRLSYLGSSILPQQINLSRAKRKSMRQYILLKQAIITEKQKQQILPQIAEQQNGEEEDNERLIVQESVKQIAGSFYTENQKGSQNSDDSNGESSGESLSGVSSSESEDDFNLFQEEDDLQYLSSKITKLGGLQIKIKR